MGEERIGDILHYITKIRESEKSVRGYFENNYAPFSRAQYYQYCKTLQKYGEAGLRDKREEGNYTKLTQRIKDYIAAIVKADSTISAKQLQNKIQNQFKEDISRTSINNFRKSIGLTREKPPEESDYKVQQSGGGEIFTSLAFFSGIIDLYTKTIVKRINEVRESSLFSQNKAVRKDHPGFRVQGKFTKEYNQLKKGQIAL